MLFFLAWIPVNPSLCTSNPRRRLNATPSISKLCLLLVFGSAASGCATMSVPKDVAKSADAYEQRTTKNGLTVAVHMIRTGAEMDQVFNTDLRADGILPILVVVENHNDSSTFVIAKQKISLVDSEGRREIEAQRRGATSPADNVVGAAGVGLYVLSPILGAPLLIAGLKLSSDAQIVQHNVRDKEFYSQTLEPGQSVHGYVYYPWSTTAPVTTARYIVLETTDSVSGETVRFSLPIDTSFKQ
jgi:hypothetical protein